MLDYEDYKNTIWIIGAIIALLLINQWIKTTAAKEGFEQIGYEVNGLNKPGLDPSFTSIDT